MNETLVGLSLDLEVYWSKITSNESLDLGSQIVLSSLIEQSLNLSEVSVFYHSTNFTLYSTSPNLFYDATSYLSSNVNIANISDYESLLDDLRTSLSDTLSLQTLLTSTLQDNHINCSYNRNNPYYAASLINSTLNAVNITSYAWQYSSEDDYYNSDDAPVYRFKDHEISIIIGIIVVGLATIIFIMFNFFPMTTYRLLPKNCFRYHLLTGADSNQSRSHTITHPTTELVWQEGI